jgi:hypothetical protein
VRGDAARGYEVEWCTGRERTEVGRAEVKSRNERRNQMHRRSFFALALAGLTGALAGFRKPKWWRFDFGQARNIRDATFPPLDKIINIRSHDPKTKLITITMKMDDKAFQRKITRVIDDLEKIRGNR